MDDGDCTGDSLSRGAASVRDGGLETSCLCRSRAPRPRESGVDSGENENASPDAARNSRGSDIMMLAQQTRERNGYARQSKISVASRQVGEARRGGVLMGPNCYD